MMLATSPELKTGRGRKRPHLLREKLYHLFSQGLSIAEAARQAGVRYEAARYHYQQYCKLNKSHKPTWALKYQVEKCISSGMFSAKEIARKLNANLSTVTKYCSLLNMQERKLDSDWKKRLAYEARKRKMSSRELSNKLLETIIERKMISTLLGKE